MERMTAPRGKAHGTDSARTLGLVFLGVFAAGLVFILPPLPLDPLYHDYVDRRMAWGIPNAGDVLSGVLILIVGLAGLVSLYEPRIRRRIEPCGNYWPFAVFFASAASAGVSSVYYHLDPSTDALFWSRLPIAAAYMALLAIFVVDRITWRVDQRLVLPIFVCLGFVCLLHWHQSEVAGQGDQRFYALSQIAVVVALPLIWRLYSGQVTRGRHVALLILFYGLALAAELFDWLIFVSLGEVVSGHTLKHVLSAAAIGTVVLMLRAAAPAWRGEK